MKPILCIDFDGVLHSYASGWQGAEVISDPPVPGAKEFLVEAAKYFSLCVFSTRSHAPGGVEAMKEWMKQHGLDNVVIEYPTTKPPAFLTIDDRAIMFDGAWPDALSLLEFKPWNK